MKYFIYTVIFIISTAIIGGFFVAGSPKEERAKRYDERRVSDLQNIQNEIIYYWQAKQKLPDLLADINDATRGVLVPTDPETSANYEYKIISKLTFNLCANFSKASRQDAVYNTQPSLIEAPTGMRYTEKTGTSWNHPAGNFCFERKIDMDFYPRIK